MIDNDDDKLTVTTVAMIKLIDDDKLIDSDDYSDDDEKL